MRVMDRGAKLDGCGRYHREGSHHIAARAISPVLPKSGHDKGEAIGANNGVAAYLQAFCSTRKSIVVLNRYPRPLEMTAYGAKRKLGSDVGSLRFAPISVVRQSRCVGHGFPEADVRKPVTTGGELAARLFT
jgi:hypothetical protein